MPDDPLQDTYSEISNALEEHKERYSFREFYENTMVRMIKHSEKWKNHELEKFEKDAFRQRRWQKEGATPEQLKQLQAELYEHLAAFSAAALEISVLHARISELESTFQAHLAKSTPDSETAADS